MQIKEWSREPIEEVVQPAALVWAEIDGKHQTIFVTCKAIAQKLDRPAEEPLMVEECSDFVSANRDLIVAAAIKRLRSGIDPSEGIRLLPGDF